jgi:hypothetical protein
MTAYGQDDSKVDAIAKFGEMQLKALDQNTFSDILAKVSTIKCEFRYANPLIHRHWNVWAFHC